MKTFGANLRERRKEIGLTIAECAKHFDMTQPAWTFWEQGSREPKLDALIEVAKFLDTTPNDLLGFPNNGNVSISAENGSAVAVGAGARASSATAAKDCKNCPHLKKLKALEKLIAK